MLHLFNKVYIESHQKTSVPRGSKVFVFSETYNTDMADNENCLGCADNLDDYLGENTLESFLRNTMSQKGIIYIYANEADFAQIITSWLRSTTNMTREEFETWLKVYKFNCKTQAKHYDLLFAAIDSAWDSATVYDFSDVDYDPSYEFLLASAFFDINFSKKSKLKEVFVGFIQKEYESFVLDVRRNIDNLILDNDLQQMLGATTLVSDIDLDSIKTQFPALQVFKESFWQEDIDVQSPLAYKSGCFESRLGKIDLSLASPQELDAILDFTAEYTNILAGGYTASEQVSDDVLGKIFGPNGFRYRSSLLTNTLTEEQYISLVQEILEEIAGLILVPQEEINYVMLQLITYFRSLKNTNNLTKLQKFTLK